jgi:hypothetical protein
MLVLTRHISIETKDLLMDIGKKGDIFDDINRTLLEFYHRKRKIIEKMKRGGGLI